MDLQCKNCGQFLEEGDKFCRFCGCPAPEKKAERALKPKELAEQIEIGKVTLCEDDLDSSSGIWDYDKIKIKNKGAKQSLIVRAYAVIGVSILVIIGAIVGVFVTKAQIELSLNLFSALAIIVTLLILLFIALIYILDYSSKMRSYSTLKERTVIIPKYSLKKLPLFLLGGYIFEMDIDAQCPECGGEIIGDIHLEKIHGALVAICNYNRRHFYRVNEHEFFERYLLSIGRASDNTSITNDAPKSAESDTSHGEI